MTATSRPKKPRKPAVKKAAAKKAATKKTATKKAAAKKAATKKTASKKTAAKKAATKKTASKKAAAKKAATKKSQSRRSSSQKTKTQTRRSSGDRFAARRLAAQRSEGLKRLRMVLGLTIVSTAAIATIGFLNSSWFDVNEITVIGNERSDPSLIVEASGIEPGQALLEVDLDGAIEAVQLVPWVGDVAVERTWTGSITIEVAERGPSVVLPAGVRFALVDDHGRQLEIVDTRPEGYMPVSGIEGSGIAGEPAPGEALTLIALLDSLPAEVEKQIRAVSIDDGELFLELTVGGRANFGDGSELGRKLQTLETMLGAVDLSCLNTIDVRVPSAPALTRTETGPRADGTDQAELGSGDATAESNAGEEPDSAALGC